MIEPNTSRGAPRILSLLALLAAALLLSWPWIAEMGLPPMAPDTGLWIQRGDPSNPDWKEWVFGTRHFHVGFRPLTALSFSAGAWLRDSSPFVVRGTDVAFHLGGALLLFLFLRRSLHGQRGSNLGALAGFGFFLLHPVVEEIVPFSARRSYSLATFLACAGLVVASVRSSGTWGAALRGVLSGMLLALGLLANEVAATAILFLPILLCLLEWRGAGFGKGIVHALPRLVIPALIVAGVLFLRWRVVGGLGGYQIDGSAEQRLLPILQSLLSDTSGLGFVGHGPETLGLVWAALLLLGLLGAGHAMQRFGPGWSMASLAAGLWLGTSGLLLVTQGVWFPRMAHALLPAIALALACCVQAGVVGRGPGRALAASASLLIIGCSLYTSPIWRGPDPERTGSWALRRSLINSLQEISELEDGSRVLCVLPFSQGEASSLKGKSARKKLPRSARQPYIWMKYRLRDRDLDLSEFLYIEEQDLEWNNPVELASNAKRPSVRIPLEREVVTVLRQTPKLRKKKRGELEAIPASTRPGAPGPDWLFLYSAEGGSLERIPQRDVTVK